MAEKIDRPSGMVHYGGQAINFKSLRIGQQCTSFVTFVVITEGWGGDDNVRVQVHTVIKT